MPRCDIYCIVIVSVNMLSRLPSNRRLHALSVSCVLDIAPAWYRKHIISVRGYKYLCTHIAKF